MEKHAFERQARTRKRPQTGSRVYGWWSLTRFMWDSEEYRDALVHFELLRAVRGPGVPRVLKKNRKEKSARAYAFALFDA